MAHEINENTAFAKWLQGWIAAVRENLASLERTLPKKTARANRQGHSGGAHFVGLGTAGAFAKDVE